MVPFPSDTLMSISRHMFLMMYVACNTRTRIDTHTPFLHERSLREQHGITTNVLTNPAGRNTHFDTDRDVAGVALETGDTKECVDLVRGQNVHARGGQA